MNERHNPNVKKLAFLLTLSLGLSVAGCASGAAATVAVQSPVDTVYSFFKALNGGDVRSADAYLAPDSMLGRGGGAPHDFYANLTCKPGAGSDPGSTDTATVAIVACEFDAREDWGGFSSGHYVWGVELHRHPPGGWLVYDWGQG